MPSDSTPDRWVGIGVVVTPREHEHIVKSAPKSKGDDTEAYFSLVHELAIRYQLKDISPDKYAYDGAQFVFDKTPIEEFLNSRLGLEVEDWLRVIGSFDDSTPGIKRRDTSFYWVSKLKPRLEKEEHYNLIRHWWLYCDARWVAWKKHSNMTYSKTPEGRAAAKKAQAKYYQKRKSDPAYVAGKRKTSRAAADKRRAKAPERKLEAIKRICELRDHLTQETDELVIAIHKEELTKLAKPFGRFLQRDIIAYDASLKAVTNRKRKKAS